MHMQNVNNYSYLSVCAKIINAHAGQGGAL